MTPNQNHHGNGSRTSAGRYRTIEDAAGCLGLTAEALRTRCRRAATRRGAVVLAELRAGIVAFKFGRHWRVRFPDE